VESHERLASIADVVEGRLEDVVLAMGDTIFAAVPELGADDTIRAETLASCRGNVRRYVAVARRAANPPPADVPPEALDFARTVVRRGIQTDVIYQGYRLGQQELWRQWMRAADELASAAQLAEVLNVSLELLFEYVDQVLGRVLAEVQHEREQVLGGALARRAETIRLLLDGAPLDSVVAGQRLQYDLDRHHTACVLWTDAADARQGVLETTAMTLAQSWSVRRPLTLAAGAGTLWAWIGTDRDAPAGGDPWDGAVVPSGVRVAVGLTLRGAGGFRRSHEAALSVQRLMQRSSAETQIGTYEQLEITALAARDEHRARDFVARTLGPLADDTPAAARLRETLRVYLEEAENAPRAAVRLHMHRNTVLQRVARASELLGFRPGSRRLAVELALELHRMGIHDPGARGPRLAS
jgi:DNA-binding PucR family transcriptional regulator